MDVASLGLMLAGLAAAAGFAAAAVVTSLELKRLRQGERALEAEVERLQDRLWRLSESEERHRSLVEAQLDVIEQRDASGRITFANEGFAALAGRPREALIGTNLRLPVAERGPVRVATDGARHLDEAVATPGGLRWFAFVETSVLARDGSLGLLRAGRDVTERVEAERTLEDARSRAEAASHAKSRFLATVSHEVRTPLNGILGMADLLLDTPLSPEQKTYVRAMKTSGEALLSLINEILDFSRIEAGRIDLVAEPFDLADLVEGVVELLAPRAHGKGLDLAALMRRDVPGRVVGDPDRLRQVLVNLVGNAVKFTESGGVGVRVERSEAGLAIAVEDTGPGIAPEHLPALFEEFEQGDASLTRRHGGTGLGLAITRRIVQHMGGSIEVETAVGQGSRFTVRLPLPSESALPAAPAAELAGRRALVVSAAPFQGAYLAQRLTDAGAIVTQAGSPGEALASLAARSVDLLIADCALGDETVREVAREARDAGVLRSLVLLSPYDRREFGSPQASGFDGYLVKPVRGRSLLDRLRQPAAAGIEADAVASRPGRLVKPEIGAPRVLLAEDNEINALLAIKSLEKLGAIVDWARDGVEALALAEASFGGVRPAYDLMLMDVRMPRLDGLEATRRIRRLESALSQPSSRIVALTANTLQEDHEAARRAGLDAVIAKPFELETLRRLLAGEGTGPRTLAVAS